MLSTMPRGTPVRGLRSDRRSRDPTIEARVRMTTPLHPLLGGGPGAVRSQCSEPLWRARNAGWAKLTDREAGASRLSRSGAEARQTTHAAKGETK